MLTLQALGIHALMRVGVKHVLGAPIPLAWRRAYIEAVARQLPLPDGVTTQHLPLGDVASVRLRPSVESSLLHVLHLHGGGFVAGSPRLSLSFAGHLARACGCTVDLPDYRKAPEHPYPAAVQDAWTAYQALITSGVEPRRLIVAGESAGAALALSVALRARDERSSSPVAVVLLSPWIDLDAVNVGGRLRAADPVLSVRAAKRVARLYAPPDHFRRASPARSSLTGLPHLIVHCGQYEILRPQAEAFVTRARAAAVPVTYRVQPKMWHDVHAMAAIVPEAHHAVDELAATLLETVRRPERDSGSC
ncbi:alpha/beta hydrolase [Actinomadura kijaniata]|uniref:alpha/beta hydrolase n=1 Tax=Actinomadura kijaniata TaxID=46161 RepID=UPI003F1BBA8F